MLRAFDLSVSVMENEKSRASARARTHHKVTQFFFVIDTEIQFLFIEDEEATSLFTNDPLSSVNQICFNTFWVLM